MPRVPASMAERTLGALYPFVRNGPEPLIGLLSVEVAVFTGLNAAHGLTS